MNADSTSLPISSPELGEHSELISRIRAGETALYSQLVALHLRGVHRSALTLADDPDEADDLVQETFVIAYRKLGSYDGSGDFAAWLYAITRRAAGQSRRTRLRRKLLMHRDEDSAAVYVTDPGARVDRVMAIALIRECFNDLPRRQREIFDLVDLRGLTPAEAAELTNTNPSTVRAHLFKARAAIRARILSQHPRYEI